MLSRLGITLSAWFRRIVPHTMVLAILLTIVTAVMCLWLTPIKSSELLMVWGGKGSHPLMRLDGKEARPWVVQKVVTTKPNEHTLLLWSKTPPAKVAQVLRKHPKLTTVALVKGKRAVRVVGLSRKQLLEDLPLNRVSARIKGIWQFLTFAMQMCLILLAGFGVAVSGPVQRMIRSAASWPKDAGSAAALVAFVAMISGWLNWGLGLIVGAYFAREVARQGELRGVSMHYPLLGAAGYTALLIWHCGLSGSAPLKVAEAGHLSRELGLGMGPIPLSATIFSPMNLAISLSLLFAVPLLLRAMTPASPREMLSYSAFNSMVEAPMPVENEEGTWLERWWGMNLLLSLVMFAVLLFHFVKHGLNLSINLVILLFLAVGLLLYKGIRSYVSHVAQGARSCVSIILQFPLYAGIFAMLYESGMIEIIATWVSQITSPSLYLIANFFTAGVVNVFIPSGGGQWGVQGAIVLTTAQNLPISPGTAVMTVAYGDQWTNMLQPFWALALLEITGLRARDILGYTILLMLASGLFFVLALGLFGTLGV